MTLRDIDDFFVAGGTLRPQTPSYVTRPADQELFDSILAGKFCYVLTSRQMGKSSLMVRTARRLADQQVTSVIVDLTSIGTVSIEEWYLGLLTRIKSSLRLNADVRAWWSSHQSTGAPQRFTEFLHDIVLAEVAGPVIIFIDEIDTTLNLHFRDDFFAAIRAIYNARASDDLYDRLIFVLLGVATPTDLIQDRNRTPFNIGHPIVLQEFSYGDAEPLRQGLELRRPGQGDSILKRIFHWTNGHPYLTQKLCLAAIASAVDVWDEAEVDRLVEREFLSDEVQDDNLKFVQNRIQASPEFERRQMLKLYSKVSMGRSVPDDDRSPIQNHLELFGLVRVEQRQLRVRNEIYRRVFNQDWIKANMPPNRQRSAAIGLSLVAVLLVGALLYLLINRPQPPDIQAGIYVKAFQEAASPAVRVDALARLFELRSYDQQARELFYGLSLSEQKALFLTVDQQGQPEQIVTVIKGLYVSLNSVPDTDDRSLMEAMIKALEDSEQPGTDVLIKEIRSWRDGRRLADEGKQLADAATYRQAIEAYSQAIQANSSDDNPAVHYDRALAFVALKQYDRALADLDAVVRITSTGQTWSAAGPATTAPERFVNAAQAVAIVRETIRSDEQLAIALERNQEAYTALSAEVDDIVRAVVAAQTASAAHTEAALAATASAIAFQQTASALASTTAAPSPSTTPTPIATATRTPTATLRPTQKPSPRPTATPTPGPAATAALQPAPPGPQPPTPTNTATPETEPPAPAPTPRPTARPLPSATATASPRPSPTATPWATATPSPRPLPTATSEPRPTATEAPPPEPTATPEPIATETNTPEPPPSETPTPPEPPTATAEVTATPTEEPPTATSVEPSSTPLGE